MSLTLTCRCGTRFEVDETFGGQEVTCPQCQSPVKAPATVRGAIHTCDFAIASLVLALVGAFTVVGTLAAVVLGFVSIVRIQRNRQRLAGMGYAISGIVFGVVFTAICLFAISTGEVFGIGGQLRKQQLAGRVQDDPELEVVHEGQFSITRPSHDWAVAKKELMDEMQIDPALLLVHMRRDAYVEVDLAGFLDASADTSAEQVLEHYRKEDRDEAAERSMLPKVSEVKLRDKTILPIKNGQERVDLLIDMRVLGQPWTFLVRVVKVRGGQTYVLSARAPVRVFRQMEQEMRRVLDSFEPKS